MLKANEKKRLPGRVKLVGALLFAACVGIAAFVQFAAKSAATEVLTSATDTSRILVHLASAKNYSEANEFCAEEYNTQLASIEDSTANQRFSAMLEWYQMEAWIGFADLQNAEDFDWVDASEGLYTNWDLGEPTDLCVQMLATGTWKDVDCSEELTAFFCEAPPGAWATALVRVDNAEVHSLPLAKTSAEAQAYCRAQGSELYSVQDVADNARIQSALKAAAVDSAFFGLQTAENNYSWIDGSPLAFENWADGQPLENEFSLMQADGNWLTACSSEAVFGVVCTIATSQMLVPILRIDGVRNVIANTKVADVSLLDSVAISFKLKINSTVSGWSELFRLDAGAPKDSTGEGRQPAMFVRSGTTRILVGWSSNNLAYARVCDGYYTAAFDEWLDINLLADGNSVAFFVNGVEQCRREGEWVAHGRDAEVWMSSPGYSPAGAQIEDFTIYTW